MPIVTELDQAIESIDAYFRSGNSVAIDRATIRATEWEALKAAVREAKPTPTGWKRMPERMTMAMLHALRHCPNPASLWHQLLQAAPDPDVAIAEAAADQQRAGDKHHGP